MSSNRSSLPSKDARLPAFRRCRRLAQARLRPVAAGRRTTRPRCRRTIMADNSSSSRSSAWPTCVRRIDCGLALACRPVRLRARRHRPNGLRPARRRFRRWSGALPARPRPPRARPRPGRRAGRRSTYLEKTQRNSPAGGAILHQGESSSAAASSSTVSPLSSRTWITSRTSLNVLPTRATTRSALTVASPSLAGSRCRFETQAKLARGGRMASQPPGSCR